MTRRWLLAVLFLGLTIVSVNAEDLTPFLERSFNLKAEFSSDHFRLKYKDVFIDLWDIGAFEDDRFEIVPYLQSLAATRFHGTVRRPYQCDLRFIGNQE